MLACVTQGLFCHRSLYMPSNILGNSCTPSHHYSDVQWSPNHLKSPETRQCVQQFVLGNLKENIESPHNLPFLEHYGDVIMSAMASQITGVWMVCSTICSGAHQRKHQSSASLVFGRGIHRWPVNPHHKRPVPRKMFPFNDVIMDTAVCWWIPLTKGQYCGNFSHVMIVCRTDIG